MNCIEVIGIRSYSYHGCLAEETLIGGHFLVDVYLWCDFKSAALTDDLTKTINYVEVNTIVEEEMAIASELIEAVAYRILVRCQKQFDILTRTRIVIKKINPPLEGDVNYVSCIIEE
jgi:dihydroneopterin aldolase